MGVNAYALGVTTGAAVVEITKAEGMHEFATVQLGHTMMGRRIVNEVTLARLHRRSERIKLEREADLPHDRRTQDR